MPAFVERDVEATEGLDCLLEGCEGGFAFEPSSTHARYLACLMGSTSYREPLALLVRPVASLVSHQRELGRLAGDCAAPAHVARGDAERCVCQGRSRISWVIGPLEDCVASTAARTTATNLPRSRRYCELSRCLAADPDERWTELSWAG